MSERPTCESCKFGVESTWGYDWVECRAQPPSAIGPGMTAYWPNLKNYEWCGQHKPKPKEKTDG